MKIACLGWGSLIWKPGVLPVASEWHDYGPRLPIEFAREGDHGELATVLCGGAKEQPAWWVMLSSTDLGQARELLRQREEIDPSHPEWVGDTETDQRGAAVEAIRAWAHGRGIDAVVWTALPPRCDGIDGQMPSEDDAVRYLDALEGKERAHAEQYVRRVPAMIATRNRAAIERALGWTPAPFDS